MAAYPLTRPACWALTVGAPDTPLIRWAAAALWLSAAMVAVIWLLALTDDALAGHIEPIFLLVAWPAVMAWLLLAWRIWQRWVAGASTLTLEWRGAVTRDQGKGPMQGGFHVGEWHAPVRVQVVLSWQGWMLLSLSRAHDGGAGDAAVHAWLDARPADGAQADVRNRSLHQLRTLLHLPAAMTTQQGEVCFEQGPRPMASWAHSFNPGSMLRRLVFMLRAGRPSGDQAAVRSAVRPDTVFPATTVMAESHRTAHRASDGQQRGRR